jgi:hypothetical protein
MFILLSVGLDTCVKYFKGRININNLKHMIIVVYSVSFVIFVGYYFTAYQPDISEAQLAGADEALEYAISISDEYGDGSIYVTNSLRHSQVLFYTQYPTDKYISEIQWKNYPSKQLYAQSFGVFKWTDDMSCDNVHIIRVSEIEDYKENYNIIGFGTCAVAVPM